MENHAACWVIRDCPAEAELLPLYPILYPHTIDVNTQPPAPSITFSPALAETLLRISNELMSTYEPTHLLGRILELLHQLVEYDAAAVHLIDGNQLIVRSGSGTEPSVGGQLHYNKESDFAWQYMEREGSVYIAKDLHQEEQHPIPGAESVRSFMAVPLTVQEKLIGILTVEHSEPNRFDGQSAAVASLFASQASIVLAKAKLLESERQQRIFAESQLAFSYRLMQTTSIDQATAALLATIADNAFYDMGAVTLIAGEQKQHGYIVAVYGYASPEEARNTLVDMRNFQLLVQLNSERKPIYLPELRGEPRWHPGSMPDQSEARSVLLVPLLSDSQSELLGYVTLKSYQPNTFSETVITNVALLCNQTAAALRTLRLLEETRQRLNDVSVLVAMSEHLNRSYELTETLRFVLDQAISVIGEGEEVSKIRGAIVLRRPTSNTLHMAVARNLSDKEIDRFNNRPYTVDNGTFARSIGRGEWVEIGDQQLLAQSTVEAFLQQPPRQLCHIPLNVGNETLGVITVEKIIRDPSKRQLLRAIADLASSAIQKTQALVDSRQRAMELVETYDRLQMMDKQRDEFIKNITHDLKAPLTFIRGYAELMADNVLGEVNPEQKDALRVMVERTDALSKLIGEILSMKQIESRPLQEAPFNLDDVARKSVHNATMAARQAGLDIRVSTKQKRVMVNGDVTRMEQVFENLLSNAIKYSPNGGAISVSVSTQADRALVSIADQGIGIPEDEIGKIWNPYYRVAGSKTEGTGLGLANVRRVIEAHGGRVWAQSSGKGATFTFELPLLAKTAH